MRNGRKALTTASAGGLVAVAVIALGMVQFAMERMAPDEVKLAANQEVRLCQEHGELLKATAAGMELMVRMHTATDADGTPIWYHPRSWEETQKEILTILVQINSSLEQIKENTKQ